MQDSTPRCPNCQSPIPPDAPGGICPACALLGVAGVTDPAQAADAQTPAIDEVGAAFPELELIEHVGQGGMGMVFKARQPRIDRLVALKILLPKLAAQPGFAARFTREARALAKLAHPHIVAVYDFGERAGFYYLLMEFVNGVNLRQAMRAGVTPEQALLLVPRICEALQFAHDHGVLHRDIKPENILLDTAGAPKLADFGIAKLADEPPAVTGLTQTGAHLGTAAYMAPEQIEKPATVDHRADIYSLGVVLYEMLTGELPIGRFAAPSEKSHVGRGVDEVVLRALEKERDRRQQSANELKTEVEGAGGPSAVPPVKSAASYVCSPEHRASLRGQFYIYTSKGRLVLDASTLTFASDTEHVQIPLRAIRELGIGCYSAFAKPVRLDFLAVTWEEAGSIRTRLFTPYDSVFSPAWETNRTVGEWAGAVRQAAARVQGREVVFVPTGALGTKNPSPRHVAALGAATALLGMTSLLLFALTQRGHTWPALIAGGVLFLLLVIPVFAYFRPRAHRAAPNLGVPLNPWPKRIFWLFIAIVVVPIFFIIVGLVVPMLAYRSAQRPAPPQQAAAPARIEAPSPADDAAIASESEIQLRREQHENMKQRVAAGIAREIDAAGTGRDLAIAEARGDALRIARAKLRYAEENLRFVQARSTAGLVTADSVRAATLELDAAREEETRALRAKQRPR